MSIENINVIFEELIILYPSEKEWILALQKCWLASENMKEKNYTAALSNYSEALTIWYKFIDDEELNCFIDIGLIHQTLALCYQYDIKDHSLAEKEYLEAIQYFKIALNKATTDYERMKVYEKLSYLEKHRIQLTGYDSTNMEMIYRYEELSIANMLHYYIDDKVKLGHTLQQLANLKKIQHAYDESLANYENALNIFLEQPFEFGFYLNICNIINEMVDIYTQQKNCDYSSIIKYELIKHKLIHKHFIYVEMFRENMRCISQYDLARSHIELADKYMAIRQHAKARMHLRLVLAIYRKCSDINVQDYVDIKHSQLQEKLADLAVELHQYNKAYQFIKMSMKCLEDQKHILWIEMDKIIKNTAKYMKYMQEWEILETRRQLLHNKMSYIKELIANSNVAKKHF
ncbi:unnamed protein product [Rotaria sp. Silwood2]|nr:unnamed protein product [Rotaria sp. Silwood2]CAF2835359.1 unnamed protein product [Rotaria sp. Silwood2]CAF3239682.1 unnamed protein product [Rotaria sp. Silwood2]CAF4224956.1 unnamed protein product [Rotaria sp. Silwood2]CAF4225478.1 unnamed protein product [Rotaria sp. Silwood2]